MLEESMRTASGFPVLSLCTRSSWEKERVAALEQSPVCQKGEAQPL